MKWSAGRVVVALFVLAVAGLAAWMFWVPQRDPGGRVIASGRYMRWLLWSPDCRFILYHGEGRREFGATHLVRTDGSGGKLLVQDHLPAGWRERPMIPVVVVRHGTWSKMDLRLVAVDPSTGRRRALGPPFRMGDNGLCRVAPSLKELLAWEGSPPSGTPTLILVTQQGVVRTLRQFGQHQGAWDICWSPDGASVALSTSEGAIETIEVATGSKRALLRPSQAFDLFLANLAWSPDGREIAFSVPSLDAPGRALRWGADICRSAVTRRTRWMHRPEWFCDRWRGKRTRSVVYSVKVGDRKVRELLRLPRGNTIRDIAWSPDGRLLAAVCCSASDPHRRLTLRLLAVPRAKPGDWRRVEEVLPGFRSGD
jgi:hypothetical protein